jgi:PAS domain S-box-containing protein
MNTESVNILEEICVKNKCETGFIIENDGAKIDFISVYGAISQNDSDLATITKSIFKKKELTLTEIKQSKAFKSFCANYKLKSFYKKNISANDGPKCFLLLMSKNKLPDVKTLKKNIDSSINKFGKRPKNIFAKDSHENSKKILVDSPVEQIIKETINSINSVLFSKDADGSKYNFISETVRNLLGYSPEEVYQNNVDLTKLIYDGDVKSYNEFFEKLKNGEDAVVEYRVKDRFSKEHWIRHSGNPIIKNNKTIRVVGTIQDITEEKKNLLWIQRSEEQLRILIDSADDLIFVLDGFGYFSMVNKNGANALGYSQAEMIGRHFLEFIDKEDETKIAEAFTKILNSTNIITFETTFLDNYDKGRLFEISAKPLIADGEIAGMLSIGRNITERKLNEQKIRDLNSKLVEANRIISIERERARHKITVLEELNKLKSEFVSNVSHELRTPLASIVGFAETILSDSELPKETVQEFSNIILMEGKRLGKLINDILDFSKLESGEEEINKAGINIIYVIEEVIKNYEAQVKEKNLVLTKEIHQGELIINADRERITKVFGNIISNAIKFTNSGGRVSVIVLDFGKEIEIAVSDTGVGISEDNLPKLFQKFSKVQQAGTPLGGAGFGLVSAKQIVDLHKGFIKVRSQIEKGTTVIIRLPK